LTQWGGHSVPRSYTTHNKSGAPIIHRQLAELEKVGVHVKTKRCLTRILKDEHGRVKGVEFCHNYVPPDSRAGTIRSIKAKQAVVLATGGFASDISFRTAQDPRLTEETDSTNHSAATAEALIEALRIGAMPVQLPFIQLGPWGCPDEKGFGIGPWFAQTVAFQYGILVDPMTGKRFMNEMSDRKIRADAIIETGGKQYRVTPGQTIDVERLDAADGSTVELDKVLLIAEGDKVKVGTPTVDGAKVIATSQGEGRTRKVIVFKYKPKVRYRKKTGHRQFYTRLVIDRIVEPNKKARRREEEVIPSGT